MHSAYMWQEQLTSYSILRSHSGCDAASWVASFLVKHEEDALCISHKKVNQLYKQNASQGS